MRGNAVGIVDTRHVYDWVFGIYVPIGIGVCLLFIGAIVLAAVIWRRREGRPQSRLARKVDATRLELTYVLVLLGVAIFLLSVTFRGEHQEDTLANEARPAVTVEVTASRWEWSFLYTGHGITHHAGEVGAEPLVVPVDQPVRFRLRSADVIHSFWIPEVRFKRDAIPGTTETITLDFDHTGTFQGSCAEYCGLDHADMVFPVRVVPDAAFRHWLAGRGQVPA